MLANCGFTDSQWGYHCQPPLCVQRVPGLPKAPRNVTESPRATCPCVQETSRCDKVRSCCPVLLPSGLTSSFPNSLKAASSLLASGRQTFLWAATSGCWVGLPTSYFLFRWPHSGMGPTHTKHWCYVSRSTYLVSEQPLIRSDSLLPTFCTWVQTEVLTLQYFFNNIVCINPGGINPL